jgi:hypothetical protein
MSAMDVPIDRSQAAARPVAAARSRARAVPFISWAALALMATSSAACPRRRASSPAERFQEYEDNLATAEVVG